MADISASDCIAEGIYKHSETTLYKAHGGKYEWVKTAKEAYKQLWNKINGKPSPIEKKVNGKKEVVGYVCYPFDEASLSEYSFSDRGKMKNNLYRGKPLSIIVNPWCFCISYRKVDKPENF